VAVAGAKACPKVAEFWKALTTAVSIELEAVSAIRRRRPLDAAKEDAGVDAECSAKPEEVFGARQFGFPGREIGHRRRPVVALVDRFFVVPLILTRGGGCIGLAGCLPRC
jgi:hypothetical protein